MSAAACPLRCLSTLSSPLDRTVATPTADLASPLHLIYHGAALYFITIGSPLPGAPAILLRASASTSARRERVASALKRLYALRRKSPLGSMIPMIARGIFVQDPEFRALRATCCADSSPYDFVMRPSCPRTARMTTLSCESAARRARRVHHAVDLSCPAVLPRRASTRQRRLLALDAASTSEVRANLASIRLVSPAAPQHEQWQLSPRELLSLAGRAA